MKQLSGYVKTYSARLRSGSVEVEIEDARKSLPFSSTDIVGEVVRSGDKVKVQLQPKSKSRKLAVAKIELDPDSPSRKLRNMIVSELSSVGKAFTVPVDPRGGTRARFTRARYVQSGSRLDFS